MWKKTGILAAAALLAMYALAALRGPQGVPALMEKREEIRKLQEQNAGLQREIDDKRQRIERLKHSKPEQELEIRQRLKLQKPGDTTFILPDAPKP